MGLLGKVMVRNDSNSTDLGSIDIQTAIGNFHQKNPQFHCVVMRFEGGLQQGLSDIAVMTASYGTACHSLHGKNGLVLLPGELDMDLFSHRLSKSTDSTVLFQFSANSPSLALETLIPYLQ